MIYRPDRAFPKRQEVMGHWNLGLHYRSESKEGGH